MGQTALRYYIGPYLWTDLRDGQGDEPLMGWSPPDQFVGAIDLRNETDCSDGQLGTGTGTAGNGYGLFATLKALGSGYQLVGVGTLDSITMNAARRSAFESLFGYRPQGSTVAQALADLLTTGSSPDWTDRVSPVMPCGDLNGNRRMRLEYRLVGNREFRRPFRYLNDPHWNKIRDVLRRDFRRIFLKAMQDGSNIDRKVLGHWIRKYRLRDYVDQWKDLVPPDLISDARPPLDPSTTINDTFDRANADPGGNSSEGWAWTEASGTGYSVSGNRCKFVGTTHIRAATDLSTDDMYVQAAVHVVSAANIAAIIARFASAAVTGYHFRISNTAGRVYEVDKCVAGTFTRLAYTNVTFPTLPITAKLEVDGSTLQASVGGVIYIGPFTDTSITGNTRAGLYGTANSELDDFQAADTTITAISSTGLLSPGTIADDNTVGSVAWTTPSNAGASDNSYTTANDVSTATTHYLKATNHSAAIPTGATILGVQVSKEIKSNQQSASKYVVDNSVKLVKAGTISGNDLGGAGEPGNISKWPTSDGKWVTGGAGQMWGLTISESDAENSGFGWVTAANLENDNSTTASIDHMQMEIFYVEASGAFDDKLDLNRSPLLKGLAR